MRVAGGTVFIFARLCDKNGTEIRTERDAFSLTHTHKDAQKDTNVHIPASISLCDTQKDLNLLIITFEHMRSNIYICANLPHVRLTATSCSNTNTFSEVKQR